MMAEVSIHYDVPLSPLQLGGESRELTISARQFSLTANNPLLAKRSFIWPGITRISQLDLALQPLAEGGAVDAYVTTFSNEQHVIFVTQNGHVHELYHDGATRTLPLRALHPHPYPLLLVTRPHLTTSSTSSSSLMTATSTSSITIAHGTTRI
jgi:hypothetical protein